MVDQQPFFYETIPFLLESQHSTVLYCQYLDIALVGGSLIKLINKCLTDKIFINKMQCWHPNIPVCCLIKQINIKSIMTHSLLINKQTDP